MEFLTEPMPWYVAGPLIALTMFLLLYFGERFGVSSSLKTMCAISGAGKKYKFFNFEWKKEIWNLFFIIGMIIGGFIASTWLMADQAVGISQETVTRLQSYGLSDPGNSLLPPEIFNWNNLFNGNGLLFVVIGGFLIGFGARYADGCTSGHAISGLSNLQLPSLIAVVGFFIGGLIMSHLILPFVLGGVS